MNETHSGQIPRNRLRIVSLFLALLLWVVFSGRREDLTVEESRVSRQLEVPIVFTTAKASSMDIKPSVNRVYVSISGTESEIKQLTGDMLMVKLDISQLDSGQHQELISNERVEFPNAFKTLKVEDINPRVVSLDVEKKIRKTLKVHVSSKGTPAENYELLGIELTPSEVTVYGPESKVEDLSFLIGEPVDVTDQKKDLNGRVVFNYDKHFPEGTTIEEGADLEYHAMIREKKLEQTFGNMKPVFDGWEPNIKVNPRTVKVSVLGPITVIKELKKEWLGVLIPAVTGQDVPETLPLSYRWNIPVPVPDPNLKPSNPDSSPVPENSPVEDPYALLRTRIAEVEVLLNPAELEVKK